MWKSIHSSTKRKFNIFRLVHSHSFEMKLVISVVVVVLLLPGFSFESQELTIISKLNDIFNFDHNVFLLESSSNFVTSFMRTNSVTRPIPQTLYVVNFNNSDSKLQTDRTSKNTFLIVGLKDSYLIDKNAPLLDILMKMQRQETNIKIGFFIEHWSSIDDLTKLFVWCKQQVIVHVFVAIYPNHSAINETYKMLQKDELNFFAFNFFGTETIANFTSHNDPYSLFPSLSNNFQQHQLRVAFIPLQMVYFFILQDIFHLMNASIIMELVEEHLTFDDLIDRGIDVIPTVVSQEYMHNFKVYPVLIQSYQIIVPFALPYPDFFAYFKIVASDNLIVVSLLVFLGAVLILTVSRSMKHSKISMLQSVTDVLNLIMNNNDTIRYGQLSRSELFVVIPLTFMGMVFVNGILSHLRSHITRPLLQPQIQTLDDIYVSSFTIVTQNEYWKRSLIHALNNITSHDWSEKVIAKDNEFEPLSKIVEWFNFSMPFLLSDFETATGFEIQDRLQISRYHNIHVKIMQYYCYLSMMNEKFVFFDRFNEIVGWLKSSGLAYHFERFAIDTFVDDIMKRNRELNVEILNVQTYDVSMDDFPTFIVYGWAASVVLFVFEVLWNKFTLWQRMTFA